MRKELPDVYKNNWSLAEWDPELFVSTFISPDLEKKFKPTSEQLRFMKAIISGNYDEGWFAGGNSSGKTWTAKFMATHWGCFKIKPGKKGFTSVEEYRNAPYNILCTGPENKQAMELWSSIEESFKRSPLLKYKIEGITTGTKRNIHPTMTLDNGTVIEAVGLHDKGKHIEGQAYDLILCNEPTDVRHLIHCYERVLIPRTWRRGGVVCGFGTPKGKGDYYGLWRRGQKELDGSPNKFYEPRVYSQYSDSRTNPYADQEAIIRGIEGKSEDWIRERVEGKFTDSVFSAFKDTDIDLVVDPNLKASILPSTNHQYIHGVDFGRKGDYTARVTWDVSIRPHVMVDFYRAGGGTASWENIFEDLINAAKRYPGEFIYDATGMAGDIQGQWMNDLGIDGVPYQFGGSPAKKVALINNLQDYITKKKFRMGYNEQLISELRNYPADLNDKDMETDSVMALALCAHGARNYEPLSPVESYHR